MSDGFAMTMAVRAPVERVWQALRDPAEIRRWHGWNEPGLDAEIQFIFVDHADESDDEPYTLVVDPMETFLLEPHEDETTARARKSPGRSAARSARRGRRLRSRGSVRRAPRRVPSSPAASLPRPPAR